MQIILKLVEWDPSAEAGVGHRLVACPPDVEPANLESFVRQTFGDPSDVARTNINQFKGLMIGWFYPSGALQKLDPDAEASWELLVIPMVEREGTLVSLYEANARLREQFRAFYASGKFEHYTEITPPAVAYQGPRLDVLDGKDRAPFTLGALENLPSNGERRGASAVTAQPSLFGPDPESDIKTRNHG